jgi:hypothetical protein
MIRDAGSFDSLIFAGRGDERRSIPPKEQAKENTMAKSQKKSNREIRKSKADKPKTGGAAAAGKTGVVPGLENMKR